MSDVLDLVVHGDPATCRAAAADAAGVRRSVTSAAGDVRRATSTVGAWRGQAATGFEIRLDLAGRDLRELDHRLDTLESALGDFAGELTVVKSRMAHARSIGVDGGVRTSGESLLRPVAPVDGTPGEVTAHNEVVAAWNEAVEVADAARTKEQEAHKHLGDGIQKSTGDGFVVDLLQRLGFLPPDFADGDDLGAYLLGLSGLGFGAGVGWLVENRLGVFQPRVNGVSGRPLA